MKEFLIELFRFNADANIRMVSFIKDIESRDEMLRHLSHLVNCQYKWLERIIIFPETSALDWWTPVYTLDELVAGFSDSTDRWIGFLSGVPEDEIEQEVSYQVADGDVWKASLRDIALQLIFHSFHHRAQIQMMIRSAGRTPPFIDYIGKRAKKNRG